MSIQQRFNKSTLLFVAIVFLLCCVQPNHCSTNKNSQDDNQQTFISNSNLKENLQKTSDINQTKLRRRRLANDEKDYPPKFVHQPPNLYGKPNEPQTIECPIEANPPAKIKWFKDNLLLISQMPHSVEQNNDLIINELNDDDAGFYHCEATNYLGTTISDQFKLTVQSSIYDSSVRLDPRQAEVGVDKQVEFICTIPNVAITMNARERTITTSPARQRQQQQQQQQFRPEVSWKRDGKRLLVKWLDDVEDLAEARSRFVARQSQQPLGVLLQQQGTQSEYVQYVLTITRVQLQDDNSTFTCLYQIPPKSFNAKQELAHESNQATLRVYTDLESPLDNKNTAIDLPDPNLAPAIYNLVNKTTTQLLDPKEGGQQTKGGGLQSIGGKEANPKSSGLQQTLLDLFEIAKPALILFGILFLLSLLVLIQIIYLKHRKNRSQNRYMKHSSSLNNHRHLNHYHQQTYSNGSSVCGMGHVNGGGSGGGLNTGTFVDPMLNSLMGRTLSVPGSNGLAGGGAGFNGGVGKKYMSYRDHLRKVGAANTNDNNNILSTISNGCDFLDSNFVSQLQHQLQLESAAAADSSVSCGGGGGLGEQQEQFFLGTSNNNNTNNIVRPNLYNQSLAAREQARSLLQASEHMRSLSNLSHIASIQQKQQQQQAFRLLSIEGNQLNNNNNNNNNFNGSHLNLPLSFAFGGAPQQNNNNNNSNNSGNQVLTGIANGNVNLWQKNDLVGIQKQHPIHCNNFNGPNSRHHLLNGNVTDEHYQLVNCSSISPSSSSSLGRSSSGTGTTQTNNSNSRPIFAGNNNTQKESASSNHYSTIETNDDDDDRYEEVDCKQQQQNKSNDSGNQSGGSQSSFKVSRTSTFVVRNGTEGQQQERDGDKPPSGKFNGKTRNGRQLNKSYKDQLSPYAVSSICGNVASQPAPPINSEAMKALNEQFDINQLMMLDNDNDLNINKQSLPTFDVPPPPPPPQPESNSTNSEKPSERNSDEH